MDVSRATETRAQNRQDSKTDEEQEELEVLTFVALDVVHLKSICGVGCMYRFSPHFSILSCMYRKASAGASIRLYSHTDVNQVVSQSEMQSIHINLLGLP